MNQRLAENPKDRESYVVSFRDMARKRFVSMDRTNLLDPYDKRYHIVCMPRLWNGLRINIEIPVMPLGEKPKLDFRLLGLLE